MSKNSNIADFITNTLIAETGRFHEFKVTTFGTILNSYSDSQIKYNDFLSGLWKELLPALDKMPKQC